MATLDSHSMEAKSQKAFTSQLKKVYGFYTGGFIGFCILLAIAEQMGLSRVGIGYVFLGATVLLYAGIGIMSLFGLSGPLLPATSPAASASPLSPFSASRNCWMAVW